LDDPRPIEVEAHLPLRASSRLLLQAALPGIGWPKSAPQAGQVRNGGPFITGREMLARQIGHLSRKPTTTIIAIAAAAVPNTHAATARRDWVATPVKIVTKSIRGGTRPTVLVIGRARRR
jgi:hypothetical protein